MNAIEMRERHNSYGVLTTVLALVIAVVYANENYDDWDSVIAFVALTFGASYLVRIEDLDLMEVLLASFLTGLSATLFLIAIFSLFSSGTSQISALLDAWLLQASIGLGLASICARWLLRSTKS